MNTLSLSNFIASRWNASRAKKIIRIGSASVALCFFTMVISICILDGFKISLSNKVFGFGSHLQITPYLLQDEETGENAGVFKLDTTILSLIKQNKNVKHFEPFLLQNGLLQGSEELFGVIFKGLPANYNSEFFRLNIVKGSMPAYDDSIFSSQILISEKIANQLEIQAGERVKACFISGDNDLRPRSFTISGIYRTGLEKFDEYYVFCDKKHLAHINNLQQDDVEGIEITLYNPANRFEVNEQLNAELPYSLSCYTCDEIFPEIFDWLVLIDTNVWVMLIIVLIVSLISIVAILFINIANRSRHTLLLISLGAKMSLIRAIFARQTFLLLLKSMLYGNILALLFCTLQYFTHFISLDSAVYFLDYVPVGFPLLLLLVLNVASIVIAYVLLTICAFVIKRTAF
jgi:lipoprotein-releasing system permease protein